MEDAAALVLVLLDHPCQPVPVERDVEQRPEVADVHVGVEDHAAPESLEHGLIEPRTSVRVGCRLLTLNGAFIQPFAARCKRPTASLKRRTAAPALDGRTLWERVHDHLRDEILSGRPDARHRAVRGRPRRVPRRQPGPGPRGARPASDRGARDDPATARRRRPRPLERRVHRGVPGARGAGDDGRPARRARAHGRARDRAGTSHRRDGGVRKCG